LLPAPPPDGPWLLAGSLHFTVGTQVALDQSRISLAYRPLVFISPSQMLLADDLRIPYCGCLTQLSASLRAVSKA